MPDRPIQKKKDVEASKNDPAVTHRKGKEASKNDPAITQRKGKEAVDPESSKSTSAEPSHQQVASKGKERKEI